LCELPYTIGPTGERREMRLAMRIERLTHNMLNGSDVDAEDRIRAFLPQLDDLVTEGLVIIDPVDVIRYVGRTKHPTQWTTRS
jgi:PII-like signaling protein